MNEHHAEILRLIKGSPQPEVSLGSIAERIGVAEDEARRLIAELESGGRVRREGDRLIVVEAAGGPSTTDEQIP